MALFAEYNAASSAISYYKLQTMFQELVHRARYKLIFFVSFPQSHDRTLPVLYEKLIIDDCKESSLQQLRRHQQRYNGWPVVG